MTEAIKENSVVAVYPSHEGAEGALKALQKAGIDMKQLSIVGKDFHTEEHAVGFYTTGDRIRVWGGRGAFWGSLWGMLFGGAFFFIPAIGPLVVMGPLVVWLLGALEGAVVGGAAGVLGAALMQIGIPKNSVVQYELDVKAGKFLVFASGSAALVERARALLAGSGAEKVDTHNDTSAMSERRVDQAARDGILRLLSDEEVSLVSTSETRGALPEGAEFVDLEQLELGVQHAKKSAAGARGQPGVQAGSPLSRLLPRSAVRPETWSNVVSLLSAPDQMTDKQERR